MICNERLVNRMIERPRYLNRIMPFIDAPLIKVLTGVRRAGKSTIMAMLREELLKRGIPAGRILSYRFDSLQYDEIKTAKKFYDEISGKLTEGQKTYLFFDEIQEVKDWEKAVNSLMSDFDVDIYVTGANSRMMSSEISTYLTGRYIAFEVFPLAFSEYLQFREGYGHLSDNKTEFARYLRYGGFPAIHLMEYSEDEAYQIVHDIYNSIIFTDIVKRSQIRKIDQLERIVKYMFSTVGQTFSAQSISKYLKNEHRSLDVETIYEYLKKLEGAYILHRCSRYDIRGKETLKTLEKYYLADLSLQYAMLSYDPSEIGTMIENAIYTELCSRGYSVYVGKLDTKEIDFVAIKADQKLYIQATTEIKSAGTEKREYENLLSIQDNYPKYVLRLDEFASGNHEGVLTMNIMDFLLSDQW